MKLLIVLSLLLTFPTFSVQAHEIYPSAKENTNFDAKYFESGIKGRYGVIVLGGSSGERADDIARKIAAMGHNVLSLAYFNRAGSEKTPDTLELIPLEYFEEPKKWLMAREDTRNDGVILYGLSKGAELALVLASYDDEYKAVVALAPSHVVWQGVPNNIADIMSSPSSWSRKGKGLPFVSYISNKEKKRLKFSNRHRASLTNTHAVEKAKIKAERIKSPVLLLSGAMDRTWPASEMAAEICSRMNTSTPPRCSHIDYKKGDHLLSKHQSESLDEVERFLSSFYQ